MGDTSSTGTPPNTPDEGQQSTVEMRDRFRRLARENPFYSGFLVEVARLEKDEDKLLLCDEYISYLYEQTGIRSMTLSPGARNYDEEQQIKVRNWKEKFIEESTVSVPRDVIRESANAVLGNSVSEVAAQDSSNPGHPLNTEDIVTLWRDMRRGRLYPLDGDRPALQWDSLGLALLAEVERDPTDFLEALHKWYVKVGRTERRIDLEEWQQCTYEMFLAIIKHSQETRTEEQTRALLSVLQESSKERFRLSTAFEDAFKLAKRDGYAPTPWGTAFSRKNVVRLLDNLRNDYREALASGSELSIEDMKQGFFDMFMAILNAHTLTPGLGEAKTLEVLHIIQEEGKDFFRFSPHFAEVIEAVAGDIFRTMPETKEGPIGKLDPIEPKKTSHLLPYTSFEDAVNEKVLIRQEDGTYKVKKSLTELAEFLVFGELNTELVRSYIRKRDGTEYSLDAIEKAVAVNKQK